MHRRFRAISAPILGLAALAAAGSFTVSSGLAQSLRGDGSKTDNAGLLRGTIGECGSSACDPFAVVDLTASEPAPRAIRSQSRAPSPVSAATQDYGYPLGAAPSALVQEPDAPLFDIDWSVSLRGAYESDDKGDRYEALIAPNASLLYEGNRARVSLEGNAEIIRGSEEDLRLGALRMTLGADYKFDRATTLENVLALSLTQDSPDDPTLASGVTEAPVEFSGALDSTLTHRFGHFDLALRGNLERDVYGDSTLTGGVNQDNSANDRTLVGGGLRLAYAISPIVKIFADGNASHDFFDAASPSLGVKADGTTYKAKGGLSAEWDETLSAEASVGLGLRRFDEAGLSEVTTTLYDARLVYKPTRTLTLTGAFATNFTPPGPNGSGTTRIDYTASADANYRVNDWLALRALANWNRGEFEGTGGVEKGYGLGIGADYLVNSHTAVNADYGFGHAETLSNPSVDTHRVTLGVTLSR